MIVLVVGASKVSMVGRSITGGCISGEVGGQTGDDCDERSITDGAGEKAGQETPKKDSRYANKDRIHARNESIHIIIR